MRGFSLHLQSNLFICKGSALDVFDLDWLLSLLDKNDMAYICQKFKLTVTGFQRNLNNAPMNSLGTTIKTAISNGFQKKKRNKNNYLPIEQMVEGIVKDVIIKHPYISKLNFVEFAEHVEFEQDLRKYEIVFITYKLFPEDFIKNYESIVKNSKEGRYIFYGLSEELSKTPLEKIKKVIGTENLHELNVDVIKAFRENCLQLSVDFFSKVEGLVDNEESTFCLLAKAKEDMHIYILVAFLLKEKRYSNEKYKELLQITVLNIKNHNLKQLNLTVLEKEAEVKEIKGRIEKLIDYNSKIEKANKSLVTELNTHKENKSVLTRNVEELTNKNKTLDNILKRNEPLQLVYYRIISENNFIIVTKDVEYFIGTPFESVTLLPSEFKKEIKLNSNHPFKECTIFVTRTSFSSGSEWYQFKLFLERNSLFYEELGQYDISSYIQEIIQYLSRKEILIYADEI